MSIEQDKNGPTDHIYYNVQNMTAAQVVLF